MNTELKELVVNFFGAGGTHGKDILRRGLLGGITVHPVNAAGDEWYNGETDAAIVAVPIRNAKQVVREIIERMGIKYQIIDLSGTMRTSNVGLPLPYANVHHLHCLFGPQGSGNLNAISVRGKIRSAVFEHILNNIERLTGESTITLTPTTHEIHDTAMGLIQGCAHAIALILAEHDKSSVKVQERRRSIPSSTIADMISLNPNVIRLLHELFEYDRFTDYVAKADMWLQGNGLTLDRFMTPFFRILLQEIF